MLADSRARAPLREQGSALVTAALIWRTQPAKSPDGSGRTIDVGLTGKSRIRVPLVLARGLVDQLDVAFEDDEGLARGE